MLDNFDHSRLLWKNICSLRCCAPVPSCFLSAFGPISFFFEGSSWPQDVEGLCGWEMDIISCLSLPSLWMISPTPLVTKSILSFQKLIWKKINLYWSIAAWQCCASFYNFVLVHIYVYIYIWLVHFICISLPLLSFLPIQITTVR